MDCTVNGSITTGKAARSAGKSLGALGQSKGGVVLPGGRVADSRRHICQEAESVAKIRTIAA